MNAAQRSRRISAAWRTCQSGSARQRLERRLDRRAVEAGQRHDRPASDRRTVGQPGEHRLEPARVPDGAEGGDGRLPAPRVGVAGGHGRERRHRGAMGPLPERPGAASATSGSGSSSRSTRRAGNVERLPVPPTLGGERRGPPPDHRLGIGERGRQLAHAQRAACVPSAPSRAARTDASGSSRAASIGPRVPAVPGGHHPPAPVGGVVPARSPGPSAMGGSSAIATSMTPARPLPSVRR